MSNKTLSEDEGIFMTHWAERLADRLSEFLPKHILSRAKVLKGMVGIFLQSKQLAANALFEHPLKLFIAWQPNEIKEFLKLPLINSIHLHAKIKEIFLKSQISKTSETLDFHGGSQQQPILFIVSLSELGLNN